jgi:hypothetical protein
MMTGNDLGEFLRAHRSRLRPDDVGLPSHGRRRVAGLRREEVAVLAGLAPDHPRLPEVVRSLAERSESFAALWSSHTVYGKTQSATDLVHPEVGPLSLVSLSFDVRAAPGQLLVVYQPEPDSPSAQALTLLGTLHATRARDAAT